MFQDFLKYREGFLRNLNERRYSLCLERSFDRNLFHPVRIRKPEDGVERFFGCFRNQSNHLPLTPHQRFQSAANFLHVRTRVEGGNAEVTFTRRAEAGAWGDDDLSFA